MRKRKPPVAAVFILALLAAVAVFWNIRQAGAPPPGVFDPEFEKQRAEREAMAAPPQPQSDEERRQAMSDALREAPPSGPGPTPAPAGR